MTERFKIIPRTLIFIFWGNKILLIKHNSKKKIGYGKWNGIGGHIERGEDPLHAAIREIREETGLSINRLNFSFFTIIPETDTYGIGLFIFSGHPKHKKTIASVEGELKWIDINQLGQYPIMPDLQLFLDLVIKNRKNHSPRILTYQKENDGVKVQVVG